MQTRKFFAAAIVTVGLATAAASAFAGGRDPGPQPQPTEVPEPATIGLLGLGVAGMIAAKRRGSRK